jgi:hypothetical protein
MPSTFACVQVSGRGESGLVTVVVVTLVTVGEAPVRAYVYVAGIRLDGEELPAQERSESQNMDVAVPMGNNSCL